MSGNPFVSTSTVTRVDWRALAVEVNRRLGHNARGRPYTPKYLQLIRSGLLDSRRVSEVLDQILGPAPGAPSSNVGGQP